MSEKLPQTYVVIWDHDGVQADSLVPVLKAANPELQTHGLKKPLRRRDLTTWTTLRDLTFQLTGNQEEAARINNYWFTPAILRHSPPYRGNLLVMSLINKLPHAESHTVTTRIPECRQATVDWYGQHLSWMANGRLHLRDPDYLGTGDDYKVEQYLFLCGAQLVEDNGPTIDHFRRAGIFDINLVSQPWNASRHDLDPLRVHSWPHLLARLLHGYTRFRFQNG